MNMCLPSPIDESQLVDSLFNTQLSLPLNETTCPWWEAETSTVLWSYCLQDIQRVIRFSLFGRENVPRYVLGSRDEGTIISFLTQMSPLEERPYINLLSHEEKIERLVSLCQLAHTPTDQWLFFPSQYEGDTPEMAAAKIDQQSTRLFRSVPFEEWLRYSLGYPSPKVAWLLQQHEEFYQLLSMHLNACPEDTARFVEVEKRLRWRSPFAYLVVQRCLTDRNAIAGPVSPPVQWHMMFLVNPIRELFRTGQSMGLYSMLKRLSVLSFRFDRKYRRRKIIDWTRPFSMQSYYLNELIAPRSAVALAWSLAQSDQRNFTALSANSYIPADKVVWLLNVGWRILSMYAGECYIANPDMSDFLQDLVHELHDFQNYYSASAILYGLRTADRAQHDNDRHMGAVRRPRGLRMDTSPLLYLINSVGDDDDGPLRVNPLADRTQASPAVAVMQITP